MVRANLHIEEPKWRKMPVGRVKLLEVFKDFEVTVRGKGQFGRYNQMFIVEPKKDAEPITKEALEAYVENLKRRYPGEGFRLRKYKNYIVLDKPSRRWKGNRLVKVKDRVPIYFDLKNQKFYVPKWYVEKRTRLTNFIIMVTLGALGVTRVRYLKTIGR